jgi:hypothetical protein
VLLHAALGLDDAGGLRPHQQAALETLDLPSQSEGSRRRSLLVFSSKPLLEQFWTTELEAHLGECQVLPVYSNVSTLSAETLTERLLERHDLPLMVLTTYASLAKVDAAIKLAHHRDTSVFFTATCFDEAHNLHTASRKHHWAVSNDSSDVFFDDAAETSDAEDGSYAEDGSDAEEASDVEEDMPDMPDAAEFEACYPWRVYATATPRREMYEHPEIYGHSADWYRFRYIDLLHSQDPLNPMVKPFDLSISVGGQPEGAVESAEFYDWVSILRQISFDREKIRRVMVYLNLALEGDKQRRRSAEHFAHSTKQLWINALQYLHARGEAACIDQKDLVVSHANGSMRPEELRAVKDAFNAPSTDGRIHVLCSCQVFAEGVTLERVDLTVFADGKRSERDIIQSGMRGLKASAADPEARLRILLLVHLDAVGLSDASSSEEVSERIGEALRSRKKMNCMAAVLASLKEEDESLADELRELARRASASRESDGGDETPREHRGPEKSKPGSTEGKSSTKTRRLEFRAEPELLLSWKTPEEELQRLTTRLTASVVIELDQKRPERYELTKWKVDVLCQLWPGEDVPKQGAKKEVPQQWLEAAPLVKGATKAFPTHASLKLMDGGKFLKNIYHNWSSDPQKRPRTTLQEPERKRIEALPWFQAWRGGT